MTKYKIKICIKCGYFDINTERCRCENDAITDIYFERRQYINVSQDLDEKLIGNLLIISKPKEIQEQQNKED